MNVFFSSIFDQDPDEIALQLGRMSPQSRERLIVLGAIAAVILVALCWAAFVRKRPRHKRGHIKRDRHSFRKSLADSWAEIRRLVAQRERERKRIHHRPRNPTRAEVGGLPEVRDASAPDSSSQSPNP